MLPTAPLPPQLEMEGHHMAERRRRLELCRRGWRFWPMPGNGQQLSATTPPQLLEAGRLWIRPDRAASRLDRAQSKGWL